MALQRDKVTANAEKLVARGKIDQAIKEYERLLDESPNDVNTLNRIGDLWVRIERNDEAVKVFRKIADHYSRDGFFLKAIAIYKKINKLDPAKLDIYAKLAELYAKQGLAMEAKSQYTVLADYYLKHGDLPGAIEIYHKIGDLDPHSVTIHIKLGDLYQLNHQSADALREYDRVGRMLLKRGMTAEAMQVFRKALRIEAGSIDLAESLVGTLLEDKDHENAIQVLQAALESNRENPRLIALLARTEMSKGDLSSARTTLEQGLRSNPSDVVIRELLTDVYLKDESQEQALELIQPLIAVAGARSEGRLAVELLNRILKTDPSSIVALERLATAHQRLGDELDATDTLARLASVHIARSDYDSAESILRDLLTRHDDRPDLKEKLALVLHRTGRSLGDLSVHDIAEHDELVPRTWSSQAEASQAPVIEPAAPKPSAAPPDEQEIDFEFDLAVTAGRVPSASEEEPAPPVSVVQIGEGRATAGADLEFAEERVTEADVFAKYGLTDKAVEHLRGALERVPDFLPAYEKLLGIFMSEADAEAAAATAEAYTALLRQRGDFQKAEQVEQRVANRGIAEAVHEPQSDAAPLVDVSLPEPQPELPAVAPIAGHPEPAEETEEEFELDLDQFTDLPEAQTLSSEQTIADTIAAVEPPIPEFIEAEGSQAAPEAEAALSVESVSEQAPEVDITGAMETAAEIEAEPEVEAEPEIEIEPELAMATEIETPELETAETESAEEIQAALEIEMAPEPEPAPFTREPDIFDEAPALAAPESEEVSEEIELYDDTQGSSLSARPNIEDLGELDFYTEQELFEEATNKLRALMDQFPDDPDLRLRSERLAAARAKGAVPQSSAGAAQHPEPESAQAAFPPSAAGEEEDLFSAEDNFFDLAAELESELSEDVDEAATAAEEEQSLEQIFREFKKGVEQQLDSEDYDTHYNLGIAYKEMGLIDEAIGEFQLASKDPKRAIDGCSMLGLCFLEKGMPQLAIKWYSKGLENPEISEEEHLGLLYDLGNAYLEVGDTTNAHKAFIEVYGINSKYRDVVNRIKQLEEVRRVQ